MCLYSGKVVVFGQKHVFERKLVFGQKLLYVRAKLFIRAKVVVFGQNLGKTGCIRIKMVYSGISGREEVVAFGQKRLYLGKVVVFGQVG